MKKICFLLCLIGVGFFAKAQTNPFPSTDSLERFINRWIRNSAVESFQNLRLNTTLIGVLRFIQNSEIGSGLDTAYAPNDSTIRLITFGPDTFNVIIPGGLGNLDSLRTAFNIKIVNGTDTTIFEAATDDLAGSFTALNKRRVDSLQLNRLYGTFLGINGDGVSDNLSVVATANADGRIFSFNKPGTYLFSGNVTFTCPVEIVDGAILKVANGDTIRFNNTLYLGRNQCFDTTGMVLFNGTSTNEVNVRWFGATGNGSTDDYRSIQKAINCVIYSTGTLNVYLPGGNYRITKGLLLWKDANANGDPEFIHMKIRGEGIAYAGDPNETKITCAHKDNFGLGIVRGKGIIVENIFFLGPNVLNYTTVTAFDSLATYNLVAARDNPKSPFAAIVTMPFGPGGTIPSGDRYPGFESYYDGMIGNGGCTDVKFYNLVVSGFIVGFSITPNGVSQNDESFEWDGIWMSSLKWGVAISQNQSRQMVCRNMKAWSNVRTVFTTFQYGSGNGEAPYIEGLNIAGNIYQIFDVAGTRFEATDIHAESIFRIGRIVTANAIIKNSVFHFMEVGYNNKYPNWVLDITASQGVEFIGSTLSWYNGGINSPLNVKGNNLSFDQCQLTAPFYVIDGVNTQTQKGIQYRNCGFYAHAYGINYLLKDDNYQFSSSNIPSGGRYLQFGNITADNAGITQPSQFTQYRRNLTPFVNEIQLASGFVTVTVTADSAKFFVSGAGSLTGLVNKPVRINALSTITEPRDPAGTFTQAVAGRIVRVFGDTVVIGRLIEGLTTGSYQVYISLEPRLETPAVGNVTSGSATINNIVGRSSATPTLGANRYTFINGQPKYLTATGAGTATVSANMNYNDDRAVIAPFHYDEWGFIEGDPIAYLVGQTFVFTKGAMYYNMSTSASLSNILGWMVTRSGCTNTSYPPEFKKILKNGSVDTLYRKGGVVDSVYYTIQGGSERALFVGGSGSGDTTQVKAPIFVITGTKDTLELRYDFGLTLAAADSSLIVDTARKSGLPTYYYVDSIAAAISAGAAPLTATYIGYGDGSNLLTGDANFTRSTVNKSATLLSDAVAATHSLTQGFLIRNPTDAAAGAQQYSPPLWLEGQGWKTDATAASRSVRFGLNAQPIQGASNPGGQLNFLLSINGAAASVLGSLTNGGNFSVTGNITAGGSLAATTNITLGSTGGIFWGGARAAITSPTTENILLRNGALTSFGLLQFGGITSSFFGIKRNGTTGEVRLSDDSNWGGWSTGALTTNGTVKFNNILTGDASMNILVHHTDSNVYQIPAATFATQSALNDTAAAIRSAIGSPVTQNYEMFYSDNSTTTVGNTTTEATILGSGTGTAQFTGATAGCVLSLKGNGVLSTAASAGTPTLEFTVSNYTLAMNLLSLTGSLTNVFYSYEFEIIPITIGTNQDAIVHCKVYVEDGASGKTYSYSTRVTASFTSSGTLAVDVTADWDAADVANTLTSYKNIVQIFRK